MPRIKGWKRTVHLPETAIMGWVSTTARGEVGVWIHKPYDDYLVNRTSEKGVKALGMTRNKQEARGIAIKYMKKTRATGWAKEDNHYYHGKDRDLLILGENNTYLGEKGVKPPYTVVLNSEEGENMIKDNLKTAQKAIEHAKKWMEEHPNG